MAGWVTLVLLLVSLAGCVTTIERKQPVTLDKDDAFKQHVMLALQYIGAGNRELAHGHLEKAAAINKKSPELFNAYALLFQLQRESDIAEDYFKKAIAADRDFTMAHYNYGTFLYNLGRFEDAASQMEYVARDLTYDRRPQSYMVLGLAYHRLERTEQALEALQKAIQLQPLMNGAYLEAAEIYFEQKDYRRSRLLLNQYNQIARPSAASLWLELQLDHLADNKDGVASNGLKLRNMYPNSRENQLYQQWLEAQN